MKKLFCAFLDFAQFAKRRSNITSPEFTNSLSESDAIFCPSMSCFFSRLAGWVIRSKKQLIEGQNLASSTDKQFVNSGSNGKRSRPTFGFFAKGRYNLLILLISPLFIYALARFCHFQTDGFKLSKLRISSKSAAFPPSPKAEELLLQKFTYLGRGKQSFAFLGEDQQTVLKLFNNSYQRRIFWASFLPHSAKRISYLQSKLNLLHQSYFLAWEELKEETALLHLQLGSSLQASKRVVLIDKLGISHSLDLSTCHFALQRKGALVYPYLSHLMAQGRVREAQEALRSLIALLLKRCEKGIADRDPLIRTNAGFLDGKPFFIDLGPFSKTDRIAPGEEIGNITTALKEWLKKNHPSLVPPLEAMIHEIPSS
ncbi:MAG: hypothetical protein A2Y28_01815 [Chlamydiae bacterium GWC2_50_10]|nr:MAG: hypothetical protein A2Y28_01815 [Chlamydiae bacterium GWC2_50_10]HCJ84556.1 hypothetical protein [Parachlamydiales bacterium]